MAYPIANVELTSTFDQWRITTNQASNRLDLINPNANTVTANTITSNAPTLTISANTNVVGTFTINGTAPASSGDALAFSIALG